MKTFQWFRWSCKTGNHKKRRHQNYALNYHFIFSRVLRDTTPRFVHPFVRPSIRPSVRSSIHPSVPLSVRPPIGPSHFTCFISLLSFSSLLQPKFFREIKYDPCPLARNLGSRISGLVSTEKWFYPSKRSIYQVIH